MTKTIIGVIILLVIVVIIPLGLFVIAIYNLRNYQTHEDSNSYYQRIEDEEQIKFLQEYTRKQEERKKHKNETHNKRNGTPDL